MRKATFWRFVSSRFWIFALLAIGWAPIFVADFVRQASPSLDARYVPQTFALGWLLVAVFYSVLAAVLFCIHGLGFLLQKASAQSDAENPRPARDKWITYSS